MKRTICIALWLLLFTTSAIAAPRVGSEPERMCTRDTNLWGYASQCACANGKIYDERSGLCLQGHAAEKIIVQGVISSGIMAIGGETTGVMITTSEGISYELILKISDQKDLLKFSGMMFEIEGELITVNGVEIQDRKVIIADKVTLLKE